MEGDRAPRISSAILLTSSQVFRRVTRVVFVLFVARRLGPREFGTYALLLALVELVAMISGSGYVDYLTRETAKDERMGWGLGAQLSLVRCVCVIAGTGAAIAVLWLLGYPRLILASATGMLFTLFPRALSESVQGVLRGSERFGLFLAIELSLGLTLVSGAFVLLLGSATGLGAVIATEIVAAGAAAVVALTLLVRSQTLCWACVPWRKLISKASPFNLYPVLGSLYNRLDVVVLSKLAGNSAVGIYSVAYRAVEILQLIPYGALYSLLPSLSGETWEHAGRQRLERAMGFLLAVALAAVMATEVFAEPVVQLLLGPRYSESVPAVRILIWALIPMYMNFALNIGLLAAGREKIFVATASVCVAVNLIGNLLLIPRLSWKAAAAVTILTEFTLLLQNWYWIRRAIGIVPKPHGAVRMTFVFGALLAIVELRGQSALRFPIGTIGFLLFLGYFYRTRIFAEFLLAWRSNRFLAP